MAAAALELSGSPVQGGILVGKAAPGSAVSLDVSAIMVAETGEFVIAFARDETGSRMLRVEAPDGAVESRTLDIEEREFRIERVYGLPPATVTDWDRAQRLANWSLASLALFASVALHLVLLVLFLLLPTDPPAAKAAAPAGSVNSPLVAERRAWAWMMSASETLISSPS